jgi:hypothetical protein
MLVVLFMYVAVKEINVAKTNVINVVVVIAVARVLRRVLENVLKRVLRSDANDASLNSCPITTHRYSWI